MAGPATGHGFLHANTLAAHHKQTCHSRRSAGLSGEKFRIRLQVLDGDWDLHSNVCARPRTAYVSRKGSRGGAEPRSNQNYHQEHEGHEEGVARECAQNTFVCFVLFVVNNPLRASACPFLAKTSSIARHACFPRTAVRESGNPDVRESYVSGSTVVDLMRSMAKRDVTFLSGTASISRL